MQATNNNEKAKTKKSFSFRILKIKLIKNFISSGIELSKEIKLNKNEISYSISASIGMSHESRDVNIEMTFILLLADEEIFSITVSSEYRLINPKSIVLENGEIIEKKCLAHLMQLSWSHLRGIQSTLINGTPIEGYYAPVISPSKLLKDLKPNQTISE